MKFGHSTSAKAIACLGTAGMLAAFTGCNSSSSTSSVSGMLSSISGSITTDSNSDLWASISADLNTSDYGVAALNIPVVDPNSPTTEYGTINIAPTICSSSTCVNGGTVTLSLNLTTVLSAASTSTALPNGTAFPISFSNSATKLVAVPVGNSGAKVYAAVGGGTYFIGTAIPFAGLDGAGKYTPGADIFASVSSSNVTGYIGVFAGSGSNQTGVGVFADLSKLAPASTTAIRSMAVKSASSQLIPSQTSESDKNSFLYHLWKLGREERPTLRYE
jgi:hypothetical protein